MWCCHRRRAHVASDRVVEAPQVQVRDVVRHVPLIQRVENTVGLPQVQSRDVVRHMPNIVDDIQLVEKTLEVPQTQFVEKVVGVPQVQPHNVVLVPPKGKRFHDRQGCSGAMTRTSRDDARMPHRPACMKCT